MLSRRGIHSLAESMGRPQTPCLLFRSAIKSQRAPLAYRNQLGEDSSSWSALDQRRPNATRPLDPIDQYPFHLAADAVYSQASGGAEERIHDIRHQVEVNRTASLKRISWQARR